MSAYSIKYMQCDENRKTVVLRFAWYYEYMNVASFFACGQVFYYYTFGLYACKCDVYLIGFCPFCDFAQ